MGWSGKLMREVTCEVIVRPFEMTEITRFRKRRLHAAEHGLHPAPVFLVDRVQQFFKRRHILGSLRISDELRRQSAAEADMDAAGAHRLQHEIPEVTWRQRDEMGWVDCEQRGRLAPMALQALIVRMRLATREGGFRGVSA